MNTLPGHQGRLEDYSLTNRSSRTGVICSLRRTPNTIRVAMYVLHRLKFLKINFGHSSQRRVAGCHSKDTDVMVMSITTPARPNMS